MPIKLTTTTGGRGKEKKKKRKKSKRKTNPTTEQVETRIINVFLESLPSGSFPCWHSQSTSPL